MMPLFWFLGSLVCVLLCIYFSYRYGRNTEETAWAERIRSVTAFLNGLSDESLEDYSLQEILNLLDPHEEMPVRAEPLERMFL